MASPSGKGFPDAELHDELMPGTMVRAPPIRSLLEKEAPSKDRRTCLEGHPRPYFPLLRCILRICRGQSVCGRGSRLQTVWRTSFRARLSTQSHLTPRPSTLLSAARTQPLTK